MQLRVDMPGGVSKYVISIACHVFEDWLLLSAGDR